APPSIRCESGVESRHCHRCLSDSRVTLEDGKKEWGNRAELRSAKNGKKCVACLGPAAVDIRTYLLPPRLFRPRLRTGVNHLCAFAACQLLEARAYRWYSACRLR